MPIRRIGYSRGRGGDIHLLRSQRSRDLRVSSLFFATVLPNGTDGVDWAMTYLDAHTGANEDVKLEFRPTFKAVEAGGVWHGFGINVDKKTGEVWCDFGPDPSPAPTNFIVEAVVTQNTGGIAPNQIRPALIRVHIHVDATRVWLTPRRMTVRRSTAAGADDTSYRFTARAQFSDGIVGDVTTNHGVVWDPIPKVFPNSGLLRIPAATAAGTVIPIQAKYTPSATTHTGDGDMVVAAPWANDPAMPKAFLLDGHPKTWEGTINPEFVPNVLFLGDAFTGPDQPAWTAIGNKIVHDMKTDKLTRPYDVLATSMNYWRVSVPSAARGISVRCEVFTVAAGGKLFARPVPPSLWPAAGPKWTVENLLYACGMPMPTDVAPAGEAGGAAAAARTALRTRWTAIARNPPTPTVLADAVIDEWRRIGSRTFIDEIDGFPGMALGDAPAAAEVSTIPMLGVHPDRGGSALLDQFYRALSADNNVAVSGPAPGNNLGVLWAEDRPTFRFNNRMLVVAVAGFKGGRANGSVESARHIDVSLESGNVWMLVTPDAVRKAVQLDGTTPLPATVDRDVWRVMAHELGHSFGLDDEYVDLPGSFTAPESTLDKYGNTTTETIVKDSTGHFRADLVKWNWRRARKAAELSGPIAPPVGTDFPIKVMVGQAFQFAAGDKVRLRVRQFRKVLGLSPRECSTDLVVVSRNAAGDEVTVRGSPNPVELSLFGEGSVLYIPVPMPGGGAGEARMIAPKIAKWMEDNNRPLTPWPCDPAAQLGLDAEGKSKGSKVQVPAYDGYDGFWTHRNDARVVGLYSGGSLYGCGIFHAAGSCMMRNSHSDTSEFCAVCRFVMVELINPGKHWEIDRDYDRIYPK